MYELISEAVIGMIRSRQLNPGDAIPTERELMERFGAGRSSVREALRVLESRGAIAAQGRAFVVADLSGSVSGSLQVLMQLTGGTLRDLHRLRGLLEVESARAAAEACTPEKLTAIRAADEHLSRRLADWQATNGDAEIVSVAEADMAFHLSIAEAGGNVLTTSVMSAIRVVARHAYRASIAVPEVRMTIAAQHAAIIDAIAAHDPGGAQLAMLAHVTAVEDGLLRTRMLDRTLPDG